MGGFIKEAGDGKPISGVLHRTPVAQRHSRLGHCELKTKIRDRKSGKIRAVHFGGSTGGDACAAVELPDGRRSRAMKPRHQIILRVETCAEQVASRGAVEIVMNVVLARPNDLHRSVHLAREKSSFDGKVLNQASTECAANESDVNLNATTGNVESLCDRIGGGAWNLCWRPKLAGIAANMSGAIDRFHGGVSEKRHLVDSCDLRACSAAHDELATTATPEQVKLRLPGPETSPN